MILSKRQSSQIAKIIKVAQGMLDQAARSAKSNAKVKPAKAAKRSSKGNSRRTAVEAAKMRKDILAKRAKGVSVAELAKTYGVSKPYIYMIK